MNDEDARQRLAALVAEHGRYFRRGIDAALMDWIVVSTAELPSDVSLAERVRRALHGPEARVCPRGNMKPFRSLAVGYAFCAVGCECRRENQSIKIKAHVSALPPTAMAERKAKRAKTNLERYGTDHVLRAGTSSRAKRSVTMLGRHGVEFAQQSLEIRDRLRLNLLEKYGVENVSRIPEVQAARKATMLARYGVENPLQVSDFHAKRQQTMVDRFGGNAPLSSPDVRARQRATMLERHGSEWALAVPAIRERLRNRLMERYGVAAVSQRHISAEALSVLSDANALRMRVESRSLVEIAQELGVSPVLIGRRCREHGIDLPRSTWERSVVEWIRSLGFDASLNDRSLINPYELDVIVPEKKVAIELCGLWWHSDRFISDKRYHLRKLDSCEVAGWRLITIFEDELISRMPVVRARLQAILGVAPRELSARKGRVEEIDGSEARSFFERHHIQGGKAAGFVYLGLRDADGALRAAMSFTHPRRVVSAKAGRVELLRFSTDGTAIAGAASRLLKAFRRSDPSPIMTYADRRWSDGGLYRRLGFRHDGVTDPNYWYVSRSGIAREHRFVHRKDRLRAAGFGDGSEREIMMERGYNRVWDCGSHRFILD